jgi:hypothetical protein
MQLTQFPGQCSIYADLFEEPEPRRALLNTLIADMWNQEDFYLSEIARAEAGETILDLYNNLIDMQLYPDGRVIVEELRYTEQDRIDNGEPAHTELTLAEAKQLILDWLDAKAKWQAEHGPLNEGTVAESRGAHSTESAGRNDR